MNPDCLRGFGKNLSKPKMNTNHTPGPWKSIGQIIVGGHPLEHICRWSGRSANAKLIAAALDLYFGCRAALLTLEEDENYHKYTDIINTLKQAIQKAGAE